MKIIKQTFVLFVANEKVNYDANYNGWLMLLTTREGGGANSPHLHYTPSRQTHINMHTLFFSPKQA